MTNQISTQLWKVGTRLVKYMHKDIKKYLQNDLYAFDLSSEGLSESGMQGSRFLLNAEIPIKQQKKLDFMMAANESFRYFRSQKYGSFLNPEIDELLAKADESKKEQFFKELEKFIKNMTIEIKFTSIFLVLFINCLQT